ncbi:MAG: hypothetical protein U0930_00750 [Pirellulales bacterium]
MRADQILVFVLRLFGGTTCVALFATFLPTDWMAAIHAWLGAGELPRAPIVEYLTRSISLLYAIHGGFILLASTDIRRYAPLITYIALVDAILGVMLIGVGAYSGLPWHWTYVEGPSVTIPCLFIYWLNGRVSTNPSGS